ncbi:MAG: DUF2868 domain-containing protein [Nitrosomonas sp.]|nr:DUF2868 domain-containing protein [Nitrosomonas sp.]
MMAGKNHDFNGLVRLEQLRLIETSQKQAISYASIMDMAPQASNQFSLDVFYERLMVRAHRLIQDNALNSRLQQPEKLFQRAYRIILAIAVLLGGFAAFEAVDVAATLNIYWLLTVLLGFNFLSMLLWLAGMVFNIHGLNIGIAAQLASWLPARLKEKENDPLAASAARGWWETCLSGKVGKWRFSLLTHQFWLSYLLAGIAMLILLMMAKQYDFIWGTTLLPENALPGLTQLLATPMEFMGMVQPDNQQIMASRVDSTGVIIQDAATREAWAKFLLGALIIYGLLPRLLLTVVASLMLTLSERRYQLDLYLPYYVNLRQSLLKNDPDTSVIDADPGLASDRAVLVASGRSKDIPPKAMVVGIELDDRARWPAGVNDQQNILDQAGFHQMIANIKKGRQPLLIGVAAYRLPDRGVQRMISELVAATSGPTWLLLLDSETAEPVTESRKLAWFRLAQACDIPAEHVITH